MEDANRAKEASKLLENTTLGFGLREDVLIVIWVFLKAVEVGEHLIWVLQLCPDLHGCLEDADRVKEAV